MKKTLLTLGAALAASAPASAHDGDHAMTVLANIGHWLSSPTHALFSVIAGVALVAIVVTVAKKRA